MTDVSHSLLKGADVRDGKAQVAQDQMGKGKMSMEEEGEGGSFWVFRDFQFVIFY